MRNRMAFLGVLGTASLLAATASAADHSSAAVRVVSVTAGQGGSVLIPVPTTAIDRSAVVNMRDDRQRMARTTWVRGWQGDPVEVRSVPGGPAYELTASRAR
jgi:hypothetical protein